MFSKTVETNKKKHNLFEKSNFEFYGGKMKRKAENGTDEKQLQHFSGWLTESLLDVKMDSDSAPWGKLHR